MADARTLKIRIHGRVQGVSFRAWTVGNARKLGLNGWVRNRADGTVEALFSGEEQRVEEMLALCHKGPMAARVDRIEKEKTQEDSEQGFFQLPTL